MRSVVKRMILECKTLIVKMENGGDPVCAIRWLLVLKETLTSSLTLRFCCPCPIQCLGLIIFINS